MGRTSIEWTDASWNPIVGCTEISPGCANCYAARLAATRLRNTPQYQGLARDPKRGLIPDCVVNPMRGPIHAHWTGEVRFLPERLEEPLHWRKPRRIFVCDMGDLFHESVHDSWLDKIFDVMARCGRHTFQIVTKRTACMHAYLSKPRVFSQVVWPFCNVWVGTSVENQHFAEERIPLLLATPAAVRWISAEPLLGPVWLPRAIDASLAEPENRMLEGTENLIKKLDWVVCGGESGPNARAMHPAWARSLRDQCQAAGVPFFFKQWGTFVWPEALGCRSRSDDSPERISKKAAGRLLDGVEHNAFPK
jgi:protein gp37